MKPLEMDGSPIETVKKLPVKKIKRFLCPFGFSQQSGVEFCISDFGFRFDLEVMKWEVGSG